MIKNIGLRIEKYKRWEFRPGYIFDIPVYIYFLYLASRARHLCFFSNVNPAMIASWFVWYGKHEDMDKFDEKLLPISIFVKEWEESNYVEKKMEDKKIVYPCIAKPTLGRTWRDVEKIHDSKELKMYLKRMHEDILVQEFIAYPLEFWIFYYCIPGENKGHISWIVEKKFMFLHGNRKNTFEELIYHHPRAKYYYHQFKKEYKGRRWDILADGEEIQLNYIGNHCRGSVFYDVSNIITPQLEKTIDTISKKIDGFYFGRYDIKAKSREAMEQWDFKIIELNGMGSLPTHIYDPWYGIRKAYRTLFAHRKIAYHISKENKRRWYAFMSLKEILRSINTYGI